MSYADKPWLKSYDPNVKADIEIPDKSFADLLEEGLARFPKSPAIHYMGTALSFAEFDRLCSRFGAFLNKNGYGKGDVVGINLPNVPQYLITLVGSLRAGCATTGVSPLLTAKELAHQVNDSGAKVLVTLDMLFEQNVEPAKSLMPGLEKVLVGNVADFISPVKRFLGKMLKKIPTGVWGPLPGKEVKGFMETLNASPAQWPAVKVLPEDIALIQYTGGTTGLPKGVELTHSNLVANITQGMHWAEFTPGGEMLCSGFPFFHQAGQFFGLAAMATSNTQALIPDPRNTAYICGQMKKFGVTFMANVPTLYHMLMDDPLFSTVDFSRLKAAMSGAAPFSPEGIRALEKIIGENKVLEVYGMTETSPLITMNPYLNSKKIGSVGLPLPNTMVRIMDTDDLTREMPLGEEGELVACGPQIMKGYHGKPDETANSKREIEGGVYMFTGDVARMDEDGFIFIVDRAKDMLNVGGYKVFSREVEDKLYQHPAVEFCAIVGDKNPDRPGSEIVRAVIQLGEGHKDRDKEELQAEIKAFCKDNMAAYKIPKIVEFTDAIPLTAVGKVDKKVLRKP